MIDSFFGFIFRLPFIRRFSPFYEKRKDMVLYIFFGGLTTIVSLLSFGLSYYFFNINEFVSNTISFILAVAFAFFTNRIWVFDSPTKGAYQFLIQLLLFYLGRLFSFGVEMLLIFIFITKLGYNAMLIKILASFIILTLNYIISKFIIFKRT